MENQFETISSAQRNVRTVLFVWLAMALLALLGLKVSIVTWVFFEGMVAISCLAALFLTAKGKWRMRNVQMMDWLQACLASLEAQR